ncbi:hypothetical protein N8I77_000704 [Diaporthe amygdali]|nr:hypothetical protein N8I77_000704 [Diaporthe amygdali]
MFTGIAWRAVKTLLHEQEVSRSVDSTTDHGETETLYRCFWALWVTDCINSDNYVVGSSLGVRRIKVPLPLAEEASVEIRRRTRTTLAGVEDLALNISGPNRPRQLNLISESIRAIFRWTKVFDYLENRKSLTANEAMAQLFALDQQLTEWYLDLPASMTYTRDNLHEFSKLKEHPWFVAMHTIYHQSKTVLHSTIVPHFSGIPLQQSVPRAAVRTSARTALEGAKLISEIAADLNDINVDAARLPPFTGYCMYVSASILIAFIFSRDEELATTARCGLVSVLKILEAMKLCWKHLDKLWARVIHLYQTQLRHIKSSAPAVAAHSSNGNTNNDIDDLSAVKRDDGGLSEPLQDSVLLYGLNGLRKTLRTEEAAPSLSDLQSSLMQSSNDEIAHSKFPSPHSYPSSEAVPPQLPTSQVATFSFPNDLEGDFLSAEGFDFSNLEPAIFTNTASVDDTNWNWNLDIFDQNAALDDIMNTI